MCYRRGFLAFPNFHSKWHLAPGHGMLSMLFRRSWICLQGQTTFLKGIVLQDQVSFEREIREGMDIKHYSAGLLVELRTETADREHQVILQDKVLRLEYENILFPGCSYGLELVTSSD